MAKKVSVKRKVKLGRFNAEVLWNGEIYSINVTSLGKVPLATSKNIQFAKAKALKKANMLTKRKRK